ARGGGVPNLSPAEADAFLRPWREMLGPERLAWLGERPERLEVEWEGLRVLLVHGSPRSDEEPLLPWNGAGGGTGGAAGARTGGGWSAPAAWACPSTRFAAPPTPSSRWDPRCDPRAARPPWTSR